MCAFHLRADHDGDTCVDMIRYKHMMNNKEQIVEYPKSEDDHTPCGDSKNFFLEYESNSKTRGDYFATLDGPQLIVMTRSQKNRNQSSNSVLAKNHAPSNKARQ